MDLRTWNQNIYEKKYVKFTQEQIQEVCNIYFGWQTLQTQDKPAKYAKDELYYSAGIKELEEKGFSLVPSRYIKFVDRDTEMDYKEALASAGVKVKELLKAQDENRSKLIEAFKAIGYDAE